MTGFCDLNLKFPLILAISVFMRSYNFMLSWVENEKSFITSGPGQLLGENGHLILVNWFQEDCQGTIWLSNWLSRHYLSLLPPVVELSFWKGRVLTVSMRALNARSLGTWASQAPFSYSKRALFFSHLHSLKGLIVILLSWRAFHCFDILKGQSARPKGQDAPPFCTLLALPLYNGRKAKIKSNKGLIISLESYMPKCDSSIFAQEWLH